MFGYDTIGSATIGGAAETAASPAPTGTITSQPAPDGQSQRFVGTATNAASGSYTLVGSDGGITVGPTAFAVAAGAFDFTVTGLASGTYTPQLSVTGEGGTAPVTGTSAFSIIGVGGGGEIDMPPPVATPTVTSVTLSPASAVVDGVTQQYTWEVAGTNSPSQAVTLATTLGSISASGLLTRPAKTSAVQTGTVTATSTLDQTKSGTATFTVPAEVVDLPYDPPVLALVERFARPVRDISKGAWQPSSGTDLFAMVDDMALDNSDYISAAGAATCELALAPVKDPKTSSNQVVRYQAYAPAGGGLTVELLQGAVLIASWSHESLPPTPTVHEQILTTQQCDSITDYSDLRIRLMAA